MNNLEILENFIIGLSKTDTNSLLVVGRAGIGKTSTVVNTLKKLGYKQNVNYIYVSNYITPVEFYLLLERTNSLVEPRLLVLDDVEAILGDKRILGLLKAALWTTEGKRTITWMSGTHKIKNKTIEDFRGKVIIILNHASLKNPLIQAVKDRSFYYEVNFTNQEILSLMEQRIKKDFLEIPYHSKRRVLDYIRQIGSSSPQLSLRILPLALNLYKVSPAHYQILIKKLFAQT